MPIRVAVVEDDEEVRDNLADLLERSSGFSLAAQYSDAESALDDIVCREPDVVLMDINLPGMNGVECVKKVIALLPEVQVIMLTVYEDNEHLFNSLLAGANGYQLKRTTSTRLLSSIREVHAGGSPMTPQIARRVVQRLHGNDIKDAEVAKLTSRERQVLGQLAEGYRYKEIADNLDVSMDTVRLHIRNTYVKLRVHSRTEAVVKFLQHKL